MCGIAGIHNLNHPKPIQEPDLREMIMALRHRGPDEFGIFHDAWIGMVSARLSIVDLAGGQQPIGNEDGSLWIVFNGEIFNYNELRPELEARGHIFSTDCDTEVILHLYEEYGPACLKHLNGQFAIALWNARDRSLMLARDRLGIRPLYYAQTGGQLVFGSEVKSILVHPELRGEINLEALSEVFTYWSPLSPHSIFKGIKEVPPGHFMLVSSGEVTIESYWTLDFTEQHAELTEEEAIDELEALLIDATKIRLRADVPVGAYLSGGMDSSLTTAIIRQHTNTPLDTFSISFSDPRFDESLHQRRMAAHLGTQHQEEFCDDGDIARVIPDVIWHTETPILRTAPAPMYILSDLVHKHRYKVVLTGEGADEFLGGYDIFKEMRVRRFWARQPQSNIRPLLLNRLYQDILRPLENNEFRKAFFRKDLERTDSPYYSHHIRWANTSRILRFLSKDGVGKMASVGPESFPVPVPEAFKEWSPLAQAQFLEATTFLSTYLLSSQGDRMSMAHSVEGRYPFLDHRVVEFCNRLPSHYKQRGMKEKWLLRRLAERYIPPEIWQRTKQPYRAPIQRTLFRDGGGLEYIEDLLAPDAILRSEYFNPKAVEGLVKKARSEVVLGEVDEMALMGILSTQLVDELFVRNRPRVRGDAIDGNIKIVHAATPSA